MKNLQLLILILFCFSVFSQEDSYVVVKNETRKGKLRRQQMLQQSRLNRSLDLIKNENYLEGVQSLFNLSQSRSFKNRLPEIKFILGKTFMELGLFQAASFQFVSIIETNNRTYIDKSLRHLSGIASTLGDKTILEFAFQKNGAEKLKGKHQDSFYYQFGKHRLKERRFKSAIRYLNKIPRHSEFYMKARYNIGLAYAEQNKVKSSIRAFNDIIGRVSFVSNPVRAAALMGKARVYYQSQKWDLASAFYRQIPRDSSLWHDMLLEQSWTLLQAGKFRSAMNGFHSLHSSYYRDRYQPESFILRSIVYMYICKYDEMEKMLDLFKATYTPMRDWVRRKRRKNRNYYREVVRSVQNDQESFPKAIALRIYRENDFKLLHKYIQSLEKEKNIIRSFPVSWRNSGVGQYSIKLVDTRMNTSLKQVNRIVQSHLGQVQSELKSFFDQEKFLRYEGLRGKRKELKKRISNKHLGNIEIVESKSRDYFVQNGFEFWPFNGEYWLDEIGNYNYVGIQNCN